MLVQRPVLTLPLPFSCLALIVLGTAMGCSSADEPVEIVAPTSPTTGCNALVNGASDVPIGAEASEPPPARGGAIADGTYVVTTATRYTGPGGVSGATGRSVRMTVRIAGSGAQSVFDGVTRSSTIAPTGTTLHTTTTCPGTGADDVEYTATPSSLALYLIDSAGTRVYVLEKR